MKLSSSDFARGAAVRPGWAVSEASGEQAFRVLFPSAEAADAADGSPVPFAAPRKQPLKLLQISRTGMALPPSFGPVSLVPRDVTTSTLVSLLKPMRPTGFGSRGPEARSPQLQQPSRPVDDADSSEEEGGDTALREEGEGDAASSPAGVAGGPGADGGNKAASKAERKALKAEKRARKEAKRAKKAARQD